MESISQSSKVTVEYHDPSGVFPLVSRDIATRLPLRNLNWQSPPRPLRQIKSLHVEFVADKYTQTHLEPHLSRIDPDGPNSLEIVRGGVDVRKQAVKERRHQIPGFRTSPYLKIYVLRCDDKENYKEEDRRKIREWIRENSQPEGKREDHDAFEWLILHVVIPDTIAASERRWREGTKDPDELKERKGGTKLIGKSTRTVFDRLRADFNETGKSFQDRVAQIRLPKDKVATDLLPTPAVAETWDESLQERENAWSDLIHKFKVLILEPFDRRVRQYEADIAEQEARRSLPGWNFCTFFIHKEGLAKALESIGLVEDALAIYDELSHGLETVLREIAAGQSQGTATSFAAYTDDIEERIAGSRGNWTNGTNDDKMTEKRDSAALFSKDYREGIVRSNISVFDFFCYISLRQKALILRLANAKSVRVQLGADADREGGEDLVLTSEVCWRSSNFIHNAARTLRQDLASRVEMRDREYSDIEIESLVCSWVWAVAGQVLDETAAPALLDITKFEHPEPMPLTNPKSRRPGIGLGLGANQHPQRTTSLPGSKPKPKMPDVPDSLTRPKTQGHDGFRPPTSSGIDTARPGGLPGQAELATYRAELILMRRKMLEQLGRRHGWFAGWAFAKHARSSKLEEVSLDGEGNDAATEESVPNGSVPQIVGPTLKIILRAQGSFQSTFEHLTDFAIRHYFTATQSKSVETLLGDLAMLRWQQDDYAGAASYFQHILPLISTDSWDLMEYLALSTYAKCLERLERTEEYIRIALTLLAKVIAKKTEQKLPRLRSTYSATGDYDYEQDVSNVFHDLIEASTSLNQDLIQPIKSFFGDVDLSSQVIHQDDLDSFTLSLQLRNALDEEIQFEEISARLVNHDDSSLQVVLHTSGAGALKNGLNNVELRCNTVTYGAYLIDSIMLKAGRIRFIQELRPPPQPTALGFTEIEPPTVTVVEPSKAPAFVFLHPREHAFSAVMRRSRHIHIDKSRHLEVVLNAEQNEISGIEMRLRPTSAGLRLHLADAKPSGIDINHGEGFKTGQLALKALNANKSATISIPYTLEQVTAEISVRLEIHYRTSSGTFIYLESKKLRNELPLDVDVNDIFHIDALYSNFTIRTTSQTPFSVLEAKLDESPVYAVEQPPLLPLPLTVYQSQPMNLVYKITRKTAAGNNTLKRDAALALQVRYLPIDELILNCFHKAFILDLKRSQFCDLHRLLVPLLMERSRQFVKVADLELAALLGEARVPDFDTVGWLELVLTLATERQLPLESWLRQWHMENSAVTVRGNGADDVDSHHITISVDVPNVDMVFSASIQLLQDQSPVSSTPLLLALGQPVQARVHVRHTSNWSAKSVFPNVPTFKIQGDDQTQSNFVLDIGSEAETWLVGGSRRCHFTPQEDGVASFGVLLVPLRLGICPLPLVEVQQESPDPDAVDKHDQTSVSCETHYESAAQVVQVVRDIRTSRVHIAESGPAAALPPSRPGTASTKEPG